MTQHDPLRTIEEAADRCRVPVATVRYWRATNRGPRFFRMGRRLVCKESELQRYIDELEAAATGASA